MRVTLFQITSAASSWRFKVFAFSVLISALAISSCHLLENKPIKVAAHVWLGYEPMFLARNEGWLNTDLAQLVETASATESIQALVDKKVDAAALTLDETLKARAMGVPLTVVMVFNTSVGADMLLAGSNIKTIADIKGKRLGYEASSLGDVMMVNILQKANLAKSDVRLVKMTIEKHQAAWQHKEVDAVITYEPVATQLLAEGMHKLFDTRQIPNTIMDVLVVRNDIVDYSHASAIRHLISAHFRALGHLKHNPQDAAYRMAEHLKIDAHEVLGAYKGLLLPDVESNYRVLAGGESEPPLQASARDLMQLMLKHQLIKRPDNLSLLIDAQYLPKDYEMVNE